jgi:23S rRNA (adenine2503-C2)-methyltransferase
MDKDLKNKTLAELEEIIEQLGGKRYLAKYVFSFLHSKGINDIAEFSTLSKVLRGSLTEAGYYVSKLKTIDKSVDPDGTIKYLFELSDGNRIETVLLFISDRKTLCVSSQAGCAMECVFCATAKLGFKRNLTAGEIADQVNVVEAENEKVRNVVYMGMGEPLLNYDNVLKSVRILSEPAGKNMGIRHITLSTSGILGGIEKLSYEDIFPRLAISLNASDNATRTELMPINKKYPLAELIEAIVRYNDKTKKRVTFEYVLIKGINDTKSDAERLVRICKKVHCNVNLIEYNPHGGCKFQASSKAAIDNFSKILYDAGVETSVRFKMGDNIKAACGQLGASWLDCDID